MSMNPEQENFQELRRLLVLKRYEQPPPGYFNTFSDHVIARIQAGEARASGLDRLLHSLWSAMGLKPALAGAFGLAVCGLLVAGVIFSDGNPSTSGLAVMQVPEPAAAPVQAAARLVTPALEQAMPVNLPGAAGMLPQASPSIFQELKQTQERPLFQRVEQSYVVPAGN